MTFAVLQPEPFTAREFERIARTGGFGDARLELRDGEIVKMSPKHVPHAEAEAVLFMALRDAVQAGDAGLGVLPGVSLALGDYFQPLPDLVIWEPAALDVSPSGPLPARAVRLVVEVAQSTLADDLGLKLASYARAGVAEYWVADVAKGRILLHAEPDGETYARREPRAFGERFDALTLPLTIDTSALAPRS